MRYAVVFGSLVIAIANGCSNSSTTAPPSTSDDLSTAATSAKPPFPTVAGANTKEAAYAELFPNEESFPRLDISSDSKSISSDSESAEETELPEIEPSLFTSWPTVTNKPVQIGPEEWSSCTQGPTPEWKHERLMARNINGPHAHYSIVVRVSPDGIEAFRSGQTLPEGAVVVKEKHMVNPLSERSTFDAYAFMVKRESGYHDAGGDWEYGFVTLHPKRAVTRGKLIGCAKCHAKASEHDYLFRVLH